MGLSLITKCVKILKGNNYHRVRYPLRILESRFPPCNILSFITSFDYEKTSAHSNIDDMLRYADYHLAENNPVVRMTHMVIFGDVGQDAVGFQWSVGRTWNWDYYIRIDGGTAGFTLPGRLEHASMDPRPSSTLNVSPF